MDAGLRGIRGRREPVERVRVAVVTDELLEFTLPELVRRLGVPDAGVRLVVVGESKTDSTVRASSAGERGLDDLDLRRRDSHLCARLRGREDREYEKQVLEVREHEGNLPSLRSGILRVIVVVFFAGLAAVEGYAIPLF